jgi:hypothetical protein
LNTLAFPELSKSKLACLLEWGQDSNWAFNNILNFIKHQLERVNRKEIRPGTLRNYVKSIKLFSDMADLQISFAEENHAQFSSDIPNDSNQAQRTDPSELGESFGKNDQNLAQNVGVNDPNDPNDTLHTSQDGSPSYPGAEYGAKIREEMRRLTSKQN